MRADLSSFQWWPHVAVAVVLVAAAAAALAAMGQPLTCTCGIVALWSGDTTSEQNSQQFTDPYTFTHVTHGVLFYALLRLVAGGLPLATRAVLAIALESAWEVFENTDFVIQRYRAETMALGYYGDSILNAIGDIVACGIGFSIAAGLPARATVALVVVLEAALTLLIHDSLLLNLLMLFYPVEAVKNWQLGS